MDIINIFLILVTVVELILITLAFLDSKKLHLKLVLYIINILTIAWWTIAMVLYRSADENNILILTKHLYISASAIASSFYCFVLVFTNSKNNFLKKVCTVITANVIIMCLILFTNTIIKNTEIRIDKENVIYFGKYYILYVIYTLSYFINSFIRIFRNSAKSNDKTEKLQSLYLAIGYTISGTIAFITNLLLPWFGFYEFNWIGQIACLCVVLATTYTVAKYSLFNIRIITAEFLIVALWILLIIKMTLPITANSILIDIGFLIIVILIGFTLIFTTRNEVEQREKIEQLNIKLKESDEFKNELVSLATHHISSPLTAIKGYTSLIQEGTIEKGSQQEKDAINTIASLANTMSNITQDFLDVSKLEKGDTQYEFTELNLNKIFNEIVSEYKPVFLRKGLKVNFSGNEINTVIKADEKKLKQALSNIFENCLRYVKVGSIVVTLMNETDKCIIKVSDSQKRNVPAMTPKLYQRLTQAGNMKEADVIGNSLGLFVTKQIIEAHLGKFAIDSNDFGTEFRIEIPRSINT
jgi:signal transduction histidine kinase